MTSVRPWVISKLEEKLSHYKESADGIVIETVGQSGLRIRRPDMPDCLVYCASAQKPTTFDVADLELARTELPGVQFIVVVPTRISHAAYAAATELRLCVDGFGELTPAVLGDYDVALHKDRELTFLMSRFESWKIVTRIKRTGHRSFLLERPNGRPVSLVTFDQYEITADAVYTLAESYRAMDVDAIVVTNPSTHDFSAESISAAEQCGVRVVHMRDLYSVLRDSWL